MKKKNESTEKIKKERKNEAFTYFFFDFRKYETIKE